MRYLVGDRVIEAEKRPVWPKRKRKASKLQLVRRRGTIVRADNTTEPYMYKVLWDGGNEATWAFGDELKFLRAAPIGSVTIGEDEDTDDPFGYYSRPYRKWTGDSYWNRPSVVEKFTKTLKELGLIPASPEPAEAHEEQRLA